MLLDLTVILTSAFLLSAALVAFRYFRWRRNRLDQITHSGQILDTEYGLVEYSYRSKQAPVLLYFHGSPGGHDTPTTLLGDYSMLTPSRAGYMNSTNKQSLSLKRYCLSYIDLLDELKIDQVVALGISGGGPYAIAFALNHPERTQALIALEAVSQPVSRPRSPWFMRSDFYSWFFIHLLLKLRGYEGLIKSMIPDPKNQQAIFSVPKKMDSVKELIWSNWPPSLRKRGFENDMSIYQNLSLPAQDIAVPTLIIHGEADKSVPFHHSEDLANRIPSAQFHKIKNGDHFMLLSHKEEIEKVITHFLKTNVYPKD